MVARQGDGQECGLGASICLECLARSGKLRVVEFAQTQRGSLCQVFARTRTVFKRDPAMALLNCPGSVNCVSGLWRFVALVRRAHRKQAARCERRVTTSTQTSAPSSWWRTGLSGTHYPELRLVLPPFILRRLAHPWRDRTGGLAQEPQPIRRCGSDTAWPDADRGVKCAQKAQGRGQIRKIRVRSALSWRITSCATTGAAVDCSAAGGSVRRIGLKKSKHNVFRTRCQMTQDHRRRKP